MTRTLKFHCLVCDSDWEVPPNVGCPECGPNTPARAPKEIWEISPVPGTPILISAGLRDPARLDKLVCGWDVSYILDLSNDPKGTITWRPSSDELYASYGDLVSLHPVPGLIDTVGHGFEDTALREAVWTLIELAALADRDARRVLVHCAAGLRRAPHIVYAYLRANTSPQMSPVEAWGLVSRSRPFVHPHQPYIMSIERWLGCKLETIRDLELPTAAE